MTLPLRSSDPVRVIAWNVESGGSDPATIATRLRSFADYSIVALSEVAASAAPLYAKEFPGFESILGSTGGGDRLQLLIDKDRFEILESKEMDRFEDHQLNNGNHRSPLMARLKDKQTSIEFIILHNHLARTNAELRKAQAIGLREWARVQTSPVIAVGDYNFDFDFPTKQGNESFVEFMRDGVWKWIEPKEWIDSNWADANKDGKDDFPDSMLDFAFAANAASSSASRLSGIAATLSVC